MLGGGGGGRGRGHCKSEILFIVYFIDPAKNENVLL